MPGRRVLLGVIGRPHGVRGLVRVHSHTAEPADLTAYGPLQDEKGRRFDIAWRGEGVAAVAELRDGVRVPVSDRDAAARLTNLRLYIARERLPAPEPEEFYLADLIGLAARTPEGETLGVIKAVPNFGAGDMLEIEPEGGGRSWYLPFTRECAPEVRIAEGHVLVVRPEETE